MADGDFDAREIAVTVGGSTIGQLDSVGYDQSRDHELQRVLAPEAENDQYVIGDGEYTGTFAMKATSGSIPRMEELFQNNERFAITVTYADAEPRGSTTFTDCRMMSFGPADDYANSDMPMYEGEFEAATVEHN
jgi:hypothetical protein